MTRKPTGAERYFAAQMQTPEYRAAYGAARQKIDTEQVALRATSDSGR